MIYDNDKSYPFRGLRHDDRDVYKHAQKLYMGLSEEREPPNSLVNHHPYQNYHLGYTPSSDKHMCRSTLYAQVFVCIQLDAEVKRHQGYPLDR